MRSVKSIFAVFSILLLVTQLSFANESTPAGLWQTIDDESGSARSLVRISENNGEDGVVEYSAVVEKGLLETDTGDGICDKCTDERKDQPIIGMTIVNGMKKKGNKYSGGKILDPDNGKVYKCKMTLNDTGDELEVRGYIGFSLLGRSQIWKRVE